MGCCHFLTECVVFWEMDPVFFGWERVNPLCYGRNKNQPVYVVPVGIFLFVEVKKKKLSTKDFEWTHNYYIDNQGFVPWRLCRVGRSKVRSASLVKVLSDDKIS